MIISAWINNGKPYFPFIRNEKVGCSIHLSGTTVSQAKPAIQKIAGFLHFPSRKAICRATHWDDRLRDARCITGGGGTGTRPVAANRASDCASDSCPG